MCRAAENKVPPSNCRLDIYAPRSLLIFIWLYENKIENINNALFINTQAVWQLKINDANGPTP